MSENTADLKAARRRAHDEIFAGTKWFIFGEGFDSYQRTFAPLLDFHTWLQEQKQASRHQLSALDLMSDTTFLASLSEEALDRAILLGGISVNLSDKRNQEQITRDDTYGIHQIGSEADYIEKKIAHTANLASNWTWRKIREQMGAQQIESFDLIVCRGAGGVSDWLGTDLNRHFVMLSNALALLNPDHGILLTQAPLQDQHLLPGLQEEMRHRGFDMKYVIPPGPGDPNLLDASLHLPILSITKMKPHHVQNG